MNIQLICANCHQDKTEEELRSRFRNRHFSDQHRARISEGQRGKPKSLTTRARISATLMGHFQPRHTPEAKAKIAAAKRGSHHTPETKAKISAALRARAELLARRVPAPIFEPL